MGSGRGGVRGCGYAGGGAGLWVCGRGRGTGVVSRPLVILAGLAPLWGSPLVWG